MDEFGIFTESYGLKPQGKSAPMATSKRGNNNITTDTSNHARFSSSRNGAYLNDDFGAFRSAASNTTTQSFANSGGYSNGSLFNYDSMHKKLNDFGLKGSSMPSYNQNVYGLEDDVFGGMPGLNTLSSIKSNDVFSQFNSAPTKKVDSIDDLLGHIGGNKPKSNVAGGKEMGEIRKKMNGFDDLIPGFGGRSSLIDGKKLDTKSTSTLLEDPFVVLESASTPANAFSSVFSDALDELGQLGQLNNTATARVLTTNVPLHDNMDPFDVFVDTPARSEKSRTSKTADGAQTSIPKIPPFKHPTNGSVPLRPPVKPPQVSKVKSRVVSSIDELEEFSRGKVQNTSSPSATTLKDATERFEVKFKQAKELRERSAKVSRDKGSPEVSNDNSKNRKGDIDSIFSTTSRSRSAPRSRSSQSNTMLNTQSSGGGETEVGQRTSSSMKKAPSSNNIVDDLSSIFGGGQFDEVEGEPEDRRRARLGRHCRTNDRVAQAVADMNLRELQIQREQEERNRISENLDGEIKRWAAGKEGNLRALLSSLQYVLWTESGWQAVSLTDIITSNSVKKIYRKATLCVHPDKVQQKGANLEQKYVAEKVFDILKEAYNKFNKEELS